MGFTPKFIYFDLDDTLLDHKLAERNALHDIYHHFDLFDSIDSKQLVSTYQTVNSNQWSLYSRAEVSREELQRNRFELTLRELNLADNRFDEIGTRYMHYYQNHWQWITGAEEAFKAILNDYSVGILTNGFLETQKKKFEQFDLYNQASHLVISEEVGVMKPHPQVFDHATQLTGYQPADILYIGDSFTSDVKGGTDFGWKVAWFTDESQNGQKNKADFTFSNFSDLCNYVGLKGE